MRLELNRKGLVRCENGRCYPCLIINQDTDFGHILPRVYIQFLKERPDFIIVQKITVNMDRVSFGIQTS
jgi:hypothetical protein